jgi:predicted nucleic acid-binding Zn ribbon protein
LSSVWGAFLDKCAPSAYTCLMPSYEMSCHEHGPTVVTVPVEERNDPRECECGMPLRRVYSMPAVKYRGTGFYTTDAGNLDKQRAMGRKMVESGEIRPNANLVD